MRFVLASGSPRRRELLASVGLDFAIDVPHIEEIRGPDESPEEYVRRLAREKAETVTARNPGSFVIAADTTVEIDSTILEKPADAAEARTMLRRLAGRTHVVWTGVAVARPGGDLDVRHERSDVAISPLSDAEIAWYVGTGEPMDKAGAYAVQGIGSLFIERVSGSYSNVVGLPLATVRRMLIAAGVDLAAELKPSIAGS